LKILVDGYAADDPTLFGHQLQAQPGDFMGLHLVDGRTGEGNAARLRGQRPRKRLQQRGFSRAVAAQQGQDLVLADLERNVEQNMRIAVKGIDAVDFEQTHDSSTPPRYASCTALLAWISSGVPSARKFPSYSTVILSASSNMA